MTVWSGATCGTQCPQVGQRSRLDRAAAAATGRCGRAAGGHSHTTGLGGDGRGGRSDDECALTAAVCCGRPEGWHWRSIG